MQPPPLADKFTYLKYCNIGKNLGHGQTLELNLLAGFIKKMLLKDTLSVSRPVYI